MAESFLVRRGSLSSGNISLNIWNGSSPPENSVGVFGETTENVSQIYVVPEGLASEGTWETGYTALPIKSSMLGTPTNNGPVIYHKFTSQRRIYTYDISSDIWSEIATEPEFTGYSSMKYVDGILYVFSSSSTNYAVNGSLALQKMDVNSKTWTESQISMSGITQTCGCAYLNGKIYVSITYRNTNNYFCPGFNSYDISSDVCTLSGYASSSQARGSYVSQQYDEQYVYQAGGIYSRVALRWDLLSAQFIGFAVPSELTESNTFSGFIIGDKIMLFDQSHLQPRYLIIGGTNKWYWEDDAMPGLVYGAYQYTQGINIGMDGWVFGAGSSYDMVFKYTANGDTETFPAGSLVVECGKTENDAEIVSGEETKATISVKNVYYSDGETLSVIPGKVRITGGSWTDIVS